MKDSDARGDGTIAEVEDGARAKALQDSRGLKSPVGSRGAGNEADACTESVQGLHDSSLPSYDDPKPSSPLASDTEANLSAVGFPLLLRNAQTMIAYLQERNRDLTVENKRLKEDKQRAKDALGCPDCEVHERRARENAKALYRASLEVESSKVSESSLQRTMETQKHALRHASKRIEVMRPIYDFQKTDPSLNFIRVSQADHELAKKDREIESLKFQLSLERDMIAEWRPDLETKSTVIRFLGRKILALQEEKVGGLDRDELLEDHRRELKELREWRRDADAWLFDKEREIIHYQGRVEDAERGEKNWRDLYNEMKSFYNEYADGELTDLTERFYGEVLQT